MSNRSQYNKIKRRLGTGSANVSNTAAQFSFEMLDKIRSGTTESILERISEHRASHDLNLTDGEKFILAHAAKGTRWSDVKEDLKQVKPDHRRIEDIQGELLRKI